MQESTAPMLCGLTHKPTYSLEANLVNTLHNMHYILSELDLVDIELGEESNGTCIVIVFLDVLCVHTDGRLTHYTIYYK